MNTRTERPTQPPSAADAAADTFAARLRELEQGRRTTSGLFRALAEAWAERNENR